MIILGNGHDIAYGLDTSYKSFINSDFFPKSEYEGDLFSYIRDQLAWNKWSDLESLLYEYAKDWEICFAGNDKYQPAGIITNDYPTVYHDPRISEIKRFKKQYYELTKQLKLYINNQINAGASINIALAQLQKSWKEECISGSSSILTFNYTEPQMMPILVTLHVHGSLKNDNIILGIDQSMDDLPGDYDFLKKSNHSPSVIGLSQKLSEMERYIIFGSSIGMTDRWFYEQIFKGAKGKIFEIYFLDEDARLALNSNISNIVGDWELFQSENMVRFQPCDKLIQLVLQNRENYRDQMSNYYLIQERIKYNK